MWDAHDDKAKRHEQHIDETFAHTAVLSNKYTGLSFGRSQAFCFGLNILALVYGAFSQGIKPRSPTYA